MDEVTDFHSAKPDETNACISEPHKPLQDMFRSRSTSTSSTSSGDDYIPNNNKGDHQSTVLNGHDNPYNLDVGSAVQYFEKYGVIRWIGMLSGDKKIYAKVEMVIMYIELLATF